MSRMDDTTKDRLTILNLPDEILLNILRNVNVIDILFSLVGISERFDRLIVDPLYIRHVNMTNMIIQNSFYGNVSPSDAQILSKFCQNILPRIHHHVQQITLAPYSIQSILHSVENYPQLHSLSLVHFHEYILYKYLTDDMILHDLLSKQITHLIVDITPTANLCSENFAKNLVLILSLCGRLTDLNFCEVFLTRKCWISIYPVRSTDYMSSTLVKLKINVSTFVDCLYLLDGRLSSLSTLIINVASIFDPVINIGRTRKVPTLKCFSFTSFSSTFRYDDLIVPLLCRMTNLEELHLFLSVMRLNSSYVDGIQLYNQFLIHMTQLRKFAFNIQTTVFNDDLIIELPSNEDIQRSFIGRIYKHVASHINTTSDDDKKCHIYSLPYAFNYFVNLTNSFPGGMFDKVRYLRMNDSDPFEFHFFQLISQDFPALKFLYISNSHPQENKQHLSTSITFPHLIFLDLTDAHLDYAKQFLLTKNAYLPCLTNLCIRYKSLATITNDFSNDIAQFNFTALRHIDVCESFVHQEIFYQYFLL